ncbi:RNA polymerase sigma factor [Paludisphaera rhizosphaerae]|uniref:RNA polymerase sigma factor n=1 Tax=Paludisphaera rhizosphaerae TaxID=2711216 RepID=UPI0013ECD894|nr:sigma-70 family RNA polymerase sigma factor [Paludisphaera rhizosphaerae]
MIERATDAILLRRFAEGREEAAFAELVERHGPGVKRVCRRFLRSEHDAEDVFQATFLLLALRASDVAWRSSVAGWVGDVARRLALHARSEIARRSRRETLASSLPGDFRFGDAGPLPDLECPLSAFTEEIERRDVRQAIDGALDDLPEKYRAPLALCYLEGKTNQEAAAALGYPVGSISRRLDRARSLLRKSLIGRGVTLGLLLAATVWAASFLRSDHRPDLPPTSGTIATAATHPDALRAAGLTELLAALERNDGEGLDRARIEAGVEHADRAAVVREESRNLAGATRLAARELAAKPDGSAASRLLATCVRCHVALH